MWRLERKNIGDIIFQFVEQKKEIEGRGEKERERIIDVALTKVFNLTFEVQWVDWCAESGKFISNKISSHFAVTLSEILFTAGNKFADMRDKREREREKERQSVICNVKFYIHISLLLFTQSTRGREKRRKERKTKKGRLCLFYYTSLEVCLLRFKCRLRFIQD